MPKLRFFGGIEDKKEHYVDASAEAFAKRDGEDYYCYNKRRVSFWYGNKRYLCEYMVKADLDSEKLKEINMALASINNIDIVKIVFSEGCYPQ